jgi:hypothetical protein
MKAQRRSKIAFERPSKKNIRIGLDLMSRITSSPSLRLLVLSLICCGPPLLSLRLLLAVAVVDEEEEEEEEEGILLRASRKEVLYLSFM